MEELNCVLETKLETVLCYETTFELGDFYVSPLVFRHTIFDQKPIIPVAFLIHDRKFPDAHEMFLKILKDKIPNLQKKKFVVMDRESALKIAFTNVFPQCTILHCWNHIKRDLRFWLQKHGGNSDDIAIYQNDLVEIMRSDSLEAFEINIERLSAKWSQAMVSYFNDNLKDDIQYRSSKFVLEPLGLYDPYSGITNNASESMNNMIKELQKWKEGPVDVAALCFYQLQNYFFAEIRRGFARIGSYRLNSDYKSYACLPEDILIPQGVSHPTEIVQKIKESENNKPFDKGPLLDVSESNNNETISSFPGLPNATSVDDRQRNEGQRPSAAGFSQRALAEAVIREGRICHVANMGSFMVKGSCGERYAISLFPKERCQCPSTGQCYHIIAAKMSIGMPDVAGKRVINLTQLKRNSRKRLDKEGGRKRPRTNDEISVILPAPDASLLETSVANTTDFDISINSNIVGPNYFSTPKKPKLLSEFSTPKKPGILIKHNNDGKQNCKETSLKSVTDKSKVKFKDDIGCTPIIDLPVKIPSCGDQETNKSVQLNTCPGKDKKEQNSVPNIVKKTNDTPVEVLTNSSSSISNIETQPKRMLRLSLGKKRKRSNKEESVDIDSSKKQSTIDESSAKNGKSARNLREKSVRYWLPSLQLNYHDKFLLINGNWLSDSHMRAANEIASKQFPELNGFQDTVKIPHRGKSNEWVIPDDCLKSIHHQYRCIIQAIPIWVLSFQFKDDNRVYLIDSLFANQTIPTSLKIQLAQIYGKGKKKIEIVVPLVKTQTGVSDCGPFAIANMIEFCLGNFYKNKSSDFLTCGDLVQDMLRGHLIKCFEKGRFSEFFTVSSKGSIIKCLYHVIDLECVCGLPNEYANMVGCDGCNRWFHDVCVDMDKSVLPDKWFCCQCEDRGNSGQTSREIWCCIHVMTVNVKWTPFWMLDNGSLP